MLILALDLGNMTGAALGLAGVVPPHIEAVDLKRGQTTPEGVARNLGCFLRDRTTFSYPDLICVEHYMQPAAQRSDNVTITHMLLHGALQGFAGRYGIRVEAPYTATITSHFCGKASATPRSVGLKTSKQREEARHAKKMMVWNRAVALGYFPRGSREDFDKADAAAIFDYASAHFARIQPKPLVLFGATA